MKKMEIESVDSIQINCTEDPYSQSPMPQCGFVNQECSNKLMKCRMSTILPNYDFGFADTDRWTQKKNCCKKCRLNKHLSLG